MNQQDQLQDLCRKLKLPSISQHAIALAQDYKHQPTQHIDYLIALLSCEIETREQKRAARCMKEANFPLPKSLEQFDFLQAPKMPESKIRKLSEGEYIKTGEPIIFLGEPGTGKTHLATALGICAAQQGCSVRFYSTGKLVNELVEAKDALHLNRLIARLMRVDVLILDELGFVPLNQTDAELLFQVLSERQERKSIIITTNLPFSEWTGIFKDTRLCRAIIDRVTHRCHIIETGEDSMRLQNTLKKKREASAR